MRDLVVIVGLSVAACVVTGAAGWVVLHRLRRASLRHQLLGASLLPVVAVALAVLANVAEMFLSRHDSKVVVVALTVSVGLAVLGASLVTRPVLAGFRQLDDAIAALAGGSEDPSAGFAPTETSGRPTRPGGSPAVPAELRAALDGVADVHRALIQADLRERAGEQSRRELVSFMSHDLRTPLAGLRAVVEGLEDGIVADVPRALSHLRATVGRMSLLVDDLFALSRVQGTAVYSRERRPVSMAELVNDVVFEAVTTAAAAGVRLEADIAAEDRLIVLGDVGDLTRALANLVTNAIRHTSAGSTVLVGVRRAGTGAVQVEVVDQCGGIPESHLARVFDAGWRGTPDRSSVDGGAGLGLAIVREVVQSHDGRVGVRNTADGCSFAVELPVPSGATRAAAASEGGF